VPHEVDLPIEVDGRDQSKGHSVERAETLRLELTARGTKYYKDDDLN
jgi:hypothetical protein